MAEEFELTTVYTEKDADLKYLKDKTVAIVGYGSQGHAQAQNLRDSGVNVIVANRKGGKNYDLAKKHGFKPVTNEEAAKQGDLVQILVPDEIQARVYNEDIAPHMKKGKTLVFSHGFSIVYNQIEPPADVDVILVAPKGPGHLVRSEYEKGKGVPCLIAVQQDATKKAKNIALAHAKGVGGTRGGVIETTFAAETETDLFGEQAVLCGGVSALIKAGFETLVEAGYRPELAYFECLHEVKLIVDLINEGGIATMRDSVSNTAEYGDLTRGPRVVTEDTKKEMKKILTEIQTGSFAREWILENQANAPMFKAMANKDRGHLIEVVGKKLRKLMSWLQ